MEICSTIDINVIKAHKLPDLIKVKTILNMLNANTMTAVIIGYSAVLDVGFFFSCKMAAILSRYRTKVTIVNARYVVW